MDTPELARLRPLLADRFGLDAYILQQRLIGRGPNLIAEGAMDRLLAIATMLSDHDIDCRIIEARPPRFAPLRLRGVRIAGEQIDLLTDERTVAFGPGHRVLAVLADISGGAAAKNLKYLMAQRVYAGARESRPPGDDEMVKAILRGQPILDLYRFDAEGNIDAGVRALPGRFDPSGLGESGTLSAVRNLSVILEETRKRAGSVHMALDFGIANLPGCRLKTPEDGIHWQRDNLAALTRYGWMMAALESAQAPGALAATIEHPLIATLKEELREAVADAPDPAVVAAPLPPPPLRRPTRSGAGRRLVLGMAAATGFGLLTATGSDILAACLKWGVQSSVLPGMLTGLCFLGGFHFLKLKRHVENTPTSKTRSLSMGLVELQGRAVRKYALVSPVGQLPCVYYRLRKYRRDSKNNWRLSDVTDSGHVPFYLEDETGKVIIDPDGASVSARSKQESYGGQTASLFGTFGGDSSEKWIEETVAEGARLFILGQARENRQASPPLRERVSRALREVKRTPGAMQRYDTDGDGRICEKEWERARISIEHQVLQQDLAGGEETRGQSDRVIVGRPRQRSIPFVIAETVSEQHLLRKYSLVILPLFSGALGGLIWTILTLKDYLQPR